MATVDRPESRVKVFRRTQKKIRPSETFYVQRSTFVDDSQADTHICPDRASAANWAGISRRGRIEKRTFQPSERADRFLMVEYSLGWVYTLNGPRHLLDIPTKGGAATEFYDTDHREWMTRDVGLAAVAKHNRDILDAMEDGEQFRRVDLWAALVEIGNSTAPSVTVTIARNGMGDLDVSQECAVRLVVPTIEECERYSLATSNWEGDDAPADEGGAV